MAIRVEYRNFGGPGTPQEIRRFRQENIDLCRTMGSTVVWKHRFTLKDLKNDYVLDLPGVAKLDIAVERCPACYETTYRQSRGDCLVCFSTTLVSTETDPNMWIDANGRLTDTDTGGLDPAPLYRGYGPSIQTWLVEPDAPEEVFRISEQGVLTQVERNRGYAPWYPVMKDSDLLVNVDVDRSSGEVIDTHERYLLSTVSPSTLRGWGRLGGNRSYLVGQVFEINQLKEDHILFSVDIY